MSPVVKISRPSPWIGFTCGCCGCLGNRYLQLLSFFVLAWDLLSVDGVPVTVSVDRYRLGGGQGEI